MVGSSSMALSTALLQASTEVGSSSMGRARAKASMAHRPDTVVNPSSSSTAATEPPVLVATAHKLATEVLHPRAAKAIMAAPRTTTTTSTTSTEARHTRTRDLQARAATVALHPEVMVVSTAVRLVAMAASREDMAAHSSPGGSLTRIP